MQDTKLARRALSTLALAVACAVGGMQATSAQAVEGDAGPVSSLDAQAAGHLEVSGAWGIEDGAWFSSLDELAASLAWQDGAPVTVTVFGSLDLAAPVEFAGVSLTLQAGDASARIACAEGSQAGISVPQGSLVLSSLAVEGPLSASAGGDLVVSGCMFANQLACAAFVAATVDGCTFTSGEPTAARACDATLLGTGASLAFTNCTVSGYDAGVRVTRTQGASGCAVTVSGCAFDLASSGTDAAAAALQVEGAPWEDAAITYENNVAKVKPTTMVTVTYDANGATAGVAPAASEAAQGSKVTVEACSSLVKAGCEFLGWNTASDGTGVSYAAGQVFVPAESVTLYAQWSATGTVATVDVTAQAALAAETPAA